MFALELYTYETWESYSCKIFKDYYFNQSKPGDKMLLLTSLYT